MAVLHLPSARGQLQAYETGDAESFSSAPGPFCRIAYAAAHVVADPLAANDPWLTPAIDW
ncbi:MAG TPA: dihydrodipicolinate synthase family protein, partial [Gammaproteobacteria bacterium]|nr:dihydrodipicolinate synthase family protein [Gammaproteobacteria bacterium]